MLAFVIASLAVYRLSVMLALELGPLNAFAELRGAVWRYVRGRSDHWLWKGINCPLCLSFWLGWLAALALPWQGWAWYALTALALSGVAVALVEVTSHDA